MILLTNTSTDKLQLDTSTAAAIDVLVVYVDMSTSWAINGMGPVPNSISSVTTTDILATPGSSTIRNAKTINIRNKDASLPCVVTVKFNRGGTAYELHKVLLQPGEALEYVEGVGWFVVTNNTTSRLIKILSADDAGGQAVNTVQPWFPSAGAVAVGIGTYLFDGHLYVTTGATSHTIAQSFGGTATIGNVDYYAMAHRSGANAISATFSGIQPISSSAAVLDVAGTSVGHYDRVRGIIRISAAGTIIPQFTFSANPTGTITVKRGTFFLLDQLPGDNTLTTLGTWS